MPYDGKILSRAMARFDEDKQRRARQFRERQQQLFAREPELADIDRRLLDLYEAGSKIDEVEEI